MREQRQAVHQREYYGLYTHLERPRQGVPAAQLRRDDDDGDLWRAARHQDQRETFTWDRLDQLWHDVTTPAELDEIADLDASIYEWAVEAVIGDADGYQNGRANFYLYDHPTRGFLWLPHDLDTALDRDFLPVDSSPVVPFCALRWERDWAHYLMVVNDLDGMDRYAAALAEARAAHDEHRLKARIAEWQDQIRDAAATDPHRPFTMEAHDLSLGFMHDYAGGRVEFIDAWLSCRQNGGADADGDGFDSERVQRSRQHGEPQRREQCTSATTTATARSTTITAIASRA